MISFARDSNVPIVGVIENMSYFICDAGKKYHIFGEGGGKKLADELVLPYLGDIPLDADIVTNSDRGEPVVMSQPDSPAAKAFLQLADNCHNFLNPEEVKAG